MPMSGSTRWIFPRAHLLLATGGVAAAAMALFVASPQVAPILLIGCLLIAATWRYLDATPLMRPSVRAMTTFAAFAVWLAVTVVWSENRAAGRFAATLIALSGFIVFTACAILEDLADDVLRSIAIGFVVGVGFAIWLSLEENASGMFLRRMLNSFLPLTRAHSVSLRSETGWILEMQPYMSNKNTAAVMALAWPFALISRMLAVTPTWRWVRFATLGAAVVGSLLSSHETSKLAIIAGGLMFGLTLWQRKAAFALLVIGWVAATVLVIPASYVAYKSGAHLIDAIQHSGRHRLVIWGNTSERILMNPIHGHGLASTRVLDEMTPLSERRLVPGTNILEGTNMHSHNVFVQAWYETGAVGGLLLCLAGLPVLGWLRGRSSATAPYLFAGYTAAVVMASLSWSLVATWYIATFGLIAVWCRCADIVTRRLGAAV